MPIRPENRALYPKNWTSEIVPRIRARSGNRCECTGQCGVNHPSGWWNACFKGLPRCGIANGDVSYMTPNGVWHACFEGEVGDTMERLDGKDYRAARIVLTVAHLNHKPQDCSDDNLLHMCQGCHNRYDLPMRRAGIKARAKAARAIGDLFCEPV